MFSIGFSRHRLSAVGMLAWVLTATLGCFVLANAVVFDRQLGIRIDRGGVLVRAAVVICLLGLPLVVRRLQSADLWLAVPLLLFQPLLFAGVLLDATRTYTWESFAQVLVIAAVFPGAYIMGSVLGSAPFRTVSRANLSLSLPFLLASVPIALMASDAVGQPLWVLRPYANFPFIFWCLMLLAFLNRERSPRLSLVLMTVLFLWAIVGGARMAAFAGAIILVWWPSGQRIVRIGRAFGVTAIAAAVVLAFGEPRLLEPPWLHSGLARLLSVTQFTRWELWAQAWSAVDNASVLELLVGRGHQGLLFFDVAVTDAGTGFYLAHNSFLSAFVYGGVIGVSLLVLFSVRLSWVVFKRWPDLAVPFVVCLVALVLFADLPFFGPAYGRVVEGIPLAMMFGLLTSRASSVNTSQHLN